MNSAKNNPAASVPQRLKNIAAKNGEDFNLLLIRFANERLLYRLSISEYKDRFLLKGATLFTLWLDAPHRPTRDIDMLGFGTSEIVDIEKIFADICEVKTKDGLSFKTESVEGTDIKERSGISGRKNLTDSFS